MESMSEDWKAGFHRALIEAIVKNGSPHEPTKSPYWGSSLPDNWTNVMRVVGTVGIDYAATSAPVEASWSQFMGTFYEGDDRVYGMDVELVLQDGTRHWWRYQGTASDLIQAVIAL